MSQKKVQTEPKAEEKPVNTGEFFGQFKGGEPFKLGDVVNNGAVVLSIKSPSKQDGIVAPGHSVVFKQGDQEFTLFIKNLD